MKTFTWTIIWVGQRLKEDVNKAEEIMVIRDDYNIGKTAAGYRTWKIGEMCDLAQS